MSTSLNAAQVAATEGSASKVRSLELRCDALTTELDTIAGQFNEVWTILPPLSRRVDARLASRDGTSNHGSVSPSIPLDYEALQGLYKPTKEQFAGIDELLNRVRGLVDDGKLFVERISRLQQEREMYKSNAAKAKKLVEDSRTSLETYQQQVAVLEDRLAKSGSSESHFLCVYSSHNTTRTRKKLMSREELNSLQAQVDKAQASRRQLEAQLNTQTEAARDLQKANEQLTTKTLQLADQGQNNEAVTRLETELKEAKQRANKAQEDADEEMARGQTQRIQLLDEVCPSLSR